MSFTIPTTTIGLGSAPTTSISNTTAIPNFSFGSATTGAGDANKQQPNTGFSLMAAPQNKPLGFSAAPNMTVQPNFSFNTPASTPFSGIGTSAAITQTPTLTFNTPAPSLSLGATTTTSSLNPSLSSSGFSFGSLSAAPAITTSSPATTVALSLAPGAGFGTNIASTFNVQTTPITAPKPTATQSVLLPTTWNTAFGSTTGTTTPSTGVITSTSTGFSLGVTPSPISTGFNLPNTTTTTATPGLFLTKTTTAPIIIPVSSAAPATTQSSLGTTTTVSSSAGAGQPTINFCQLEESINKWTLELEEQEKAFVNQAAQVNIWDKLLIVNGEKILNLNQEIERVKLEQQQLEHELDYVVGQQKELQDCLIPLEKELGSLTVSDPEREYTYRLAENLDTQLKQMSEDLKEIIEHLNESNRAQDSSDPIVQIGKILNAHMNSLQWLDQRTAILNQKIQSIDQMHQNFRQENERSFNLAYN